MIISLNWLKQYTKVDLPVDELATLIGARLVEIEEVIDLGVKYKDVVIAKVVACEEIKDSDHLNVCTIDDGGVTKNVERGNDGLIEVVCGAPNIRQGLIVAWLPPGSIVPATANDSEPFVLGARKLRGYMSNGMLASAKELGIGDDHEGIVEVDKEAQAGDSFAEVYELNDYLLDIENKSLTHRPDAFGIIGFAREVAAISGKKFITPDWLYALEPKFDDKTESGTQEPKIIIEDPELCPRYEAVVLSNADQAVQSPLIIKSYLARVGVRPINAIVDTTNYLMLTTGQPLHAFDYGKFLKLNDDKAEVIVRAANEGESLKLLDGRTIKLSDQDIVICSGKIPVALAGAMGGADTEIDENTKNILLESATFNLFNLRGTQMRHGIFSEAITRFTKGQPPKLTAPVLASASRLIMGATGAQRVTELIDAYPKAQESVVVKLSLQKVNHVLGASYTLSDVMKTLERVEFKVSSAGENMEVSAPYWRADIHIPEDIIEEIGRLNGFDSIDPVLPARTFTAISPSAFDEFRAKLRLTLAQAGANEIYSYSFVPASILEKTSLNPDQAYKIVNALSPDLQHYRTSLTPSLLSRIHPNIKQSFDEFAIFEIGKIHNKQHKDSEGLPKEFDSLAIAYAANKKQTETAYYQIKHLFDFLSSRLGLTFTYTDYSDAPDFSIFQPYQPGRAALLSLEGEVIGVIGEFKPNIQKALKLPPASAGLEVSLEDVFKAYSKLKPSYTPLSRYPGTWQDICLQVSTDKTYGQVYGVVQESLKETELENNIQPIDIYVPEEENYKNITLRIHLTNFERTTTTSEASQVIESIAKRAEEQLEAKVV